MINPTAGKRVVRYEHWNRRAVTQEFIFPNGEFRTYLLLETDKKAVIIFPLTSNLDVIAIRIFRVAANKEIVELPGGLVEENSNPTDTAKRELEEETSYMSNKMIRLGTGIWFDPASIKVNYDAFLALDCEPCKRGTLDDDELIKTERMPIGEWLEKIKTGVVQDNKSIAVTLLALMKYKKLRQYL